jgi:DNA-binding response OmpR family regulator
MKIRGVMFMSVRTVLIADDEILIHRLVQPHLDRAGFQTTVVSDGARAVELVGKEPPDLIVLDVLMPKMDGLAALRLLKSTASTSSIPVIIMTSTYQSVTRNEARTCGAAGFLTKPFSPAQLLAEIARVASNSPEAPELR